ncbi:MAG: DNA double-strand break repair nuclease NurA [Sulfolobales archaeon]
MLLIQVSNCLGEITLVKLLEEVVEASITKGGVSPRRTDEAGSDGVEVLTLKSVDYSDLVTSSAAVDAASATLYIGGNYVSIAGLSVVSPSDLAVYPSTTAESYLGPPFISSLKRLRTLTRGITDRYIELGIPYEEDPYVDPSALESDVRLALELYGLGIAVGSRLKYVLIDGPLIPISRPYFRPGYWVDEVALLNSKRARYINEALSEGKVVIGFVKRVGTEVSVGELVQEGKPMAVGPVVAQNELKVCSFYITSGGTGYTYTLGKVEIPCTVIEQLGSSKLVDLLSMVYSSCSSLALSIPYGLYVADRVSKSLVKKLVELVELTAKSRGILAVLPGDLTYG